ncbi:MAG: sensor histidine kinase [Myxococcaceae bacterium]
MTASPTLSKDRILLVDDSSTFRAHASRLLEADYVVQAVSGGMAALAAALQEPPDLILTDVAMPGMDGYELCRHWRAEPVLADIPFILVTRHTDPEGRAFGLEEGADDYLTKDCSPRELMARVRSLIRLGKANREIRQQKEAIARAHDELLEAQRQLYDSEKLATLGTVASGVAHELNNPLSVVLAGVEQLGHACYELAGKRPDPRSPEEVIQEVEEIRTDINQGADRVRRIIRDLNLMAGDPERKPVWVDPKVELERALTIAQSKLIDAQVQTKLDHHGEIRLPPGYLTQIALSLLSNAADAVVGRKEREIFLGTRSLSDGLFELVVEDTGTGIPPDVLPRIFEPFFSTKKAGKGTGLGLSVCAGMIKRLGGTAQVESTVGKGCRFVIKLPTAVEGATAEFVKSRIQDSSARH